MTTQQICPRCPQPAGPVASRMWVLLKPVPMVVIGLGFGAVFYARVAMWLLGAG